MRHKATGRAAGEVMEAMENEQRPMIEVTAIYSICRLLGNCAIFPGDRASRLYTLAEVMAIVDGWTTTPYVPEEHDCENFAQELKHALTQKLVRAAICEVRTVRHAYVGVVVEDRVDDVWMIDPVERAWGWASEWELEATGVWF